LNSTHHITQLLHDWNNGDAEALNRLIPLADSELKKIARKRLRRQPGTPFHPTELVNEAWLKLFGEKKEPVWRNRRHFYALLKRRMIQILWNYVERHATAEHTDLNSKAQLPAESKEIRLLRETLNTFTQIYPRAAKIVELRFGQGHTIPQVAKMMNIGTRTVERDTEFARAWLWREITSDPDYPAIAGT
jgi:RNA polymerase sigma-70 factor, ECF subfamily